MKRYGEAGEVLIRAKEISGKASYNYACVKSLQKKPEAAIAELLACQVDGTLPDKAHLETDTNMDNLRDHAEFKALLDGL